MTAEHGPVGWRTPARRMIAVATGCGLLLTSTGAAIAQKIGMGVDDGISSWRIGFSLVICVVVAVIAAFALRYQMKMRGKSFSLANTSRLEVSSRVRLRPDADLCIVSCDGEELLVGVSANGVSLLRSLKGHSEAQGRGFDRP